MKDSQGKTSLHVLASKPLNPNKKEVLEILLNCKFVQVNNKDKMKKTALHYACHKSVSHELAERLLKVENIDINLKDNNENTPLHYASMRPDRSEVVKVLLRNTAIQSWIF